MSFTDDDLKRLKEKCEEPWNANQTPRHAILISELKSLLARLEAAEAYVKFDHRTWVAGGPNQEKLYKAWRKSAAK